MDLVTRLVRLEHGNQAASRIHVGGYALAGIGSFLITILFLFLGTAAKADSDALIANLHFIDVGNGQAILLDVGSFEILFDGGRWDREARRNRLLQYLQDNSIVDGELDLVIIPTGSALSTGNLRDLFKMLVSGGRSVPFSIGEVWSYGDPGKWVTAETQPFERGCIRSFVSFLDGLVSIGGLRLKSPIQESVTPIVDGGSPDGLLVSQSPQVRVFLLNAGLPITDTGTIRCVEAVQNGSISVGIEVLGVRILLGGDPLSMSPTSLLRRHGREDEIVRWIARLPWFQNVDILVAPRLGSTGASSPAYVQLVKPRFVLFGADDGLGYPARETVRLYREVNSRDFSTAHSREGGRHHIVCSWTKPEDIKCQYGEPGTWVGRTASGAHLTYSEVSSILQKVRPAQSAIDRSAYINDSNLRFDGLKGADLFGIDLSRKNLSRFDLTGVDLRYADLREADLSYAILSGAQLDYSQLSGAILAHAQISNVDAAGLSISQTQLDQATLTDVDLTDCDLSGASIVRASLTRISIEKSRQAKTNFVVRTLRYIFFDLVGEYGRAPNRPLFLILGGIPLFAILYVASVLKGEGAGLYATQAPGTGPAVLSVPEPIRIHHRDWRAVASAIYFSFLCAFRFGWRDINVGTWALSLSPLQYNIEPTGWVRVVSGVQSLCSLYLIAMWILLFLGNPFR